MQRHGLNVPDGPAGATAPNVIGRPDPRWRPTRHRREGPHRRSRAVGVRL